VQGEPAVTSGWLAGPRLGTGAQQIYTMMSDKFAGWLSLSDLCTAGRPAP
jgi:hypothetical protein